jgi:hypothetical protein
MIEIFNMYPAISDRIQYDIARKAEFNDFYNKEGLYDHQEFVRRYLSPFTSYRGLFLFHSLGSGKSIACIAVAIDHYQFDGKRCMIVTKGDSGTENFRKQIYQYLNMKKKAFPHCALEPKHIFDMEHYISLNNKVSEMEDKQIAEKFSNKVLVFDEIHNVRKFGETDRVYNSISRIIKLSVNTKTMLATATPMINEVSQIHSTLRLLSDDYNGIISFNSVVKNRPRIRYMGTRKDVHDKFRIHTSPMISHQKMFYTKESSKGVPNDIYRGLVHASLFCFKDGTFGSDITEIKMRREKTTKIISPVRAKGSLKHVSFLRYVVEDEFRDELKGEGLRKSSCKYHRLMDILENRNQRFPVFVFVEEIKGSGLLLLANILEEHGYTFYCGENLRMIESGMKRYTFCVGSSDLSSNNMDRLEGFNSLENAHGEYVRVLLGSKVIGESITLLNVKQFHAITPHWNDSTIEQAMGRVIRSNSHMSLPEKERVVDLYIHAATVLEESSVDITKLNVCSEKQKSISVMERILKKMAVDRYIFRKSFDADTFVLYYMDRYMEPLVSDLEEFIENEIEINKLIKMIGYHKDIILELLLRVVTQNILIGGRYVREDNGVLFLTEDPTTPFHFARTPAHKTLLNKSRRRVSTPKVEGNIFESLRAQDVPSKISVFEKECLSPRPNKDILDFFSNLFFYEKSKNRIYHIICYREKENAYTAVLPVPKKLNMKTRVLKAGKWEYLSDLQEEELIMEKIRRSMEHRMEKIDDHELFGIISVIDNRMRLRTKECRDFERAKVDRRHVKKGKSLSSMTKSELEHIRMRLFQNPKKLKVKEMINDIEAYLISNGLVTVL